MGGKDFFKGIKLSKKELTVLSLSLFILFLTAFLIGGAIAKNKNTAAANANPIIVNNTEKQSLEKERNEDYANKKIGRELEKARAEEAARKAEELARAEEAERAQQRQRANEGKVVYLTFDDGPSTAVTPRVLDVLKQYDVKATFFIIGELAERNSSLVKRAVNEGHTIANHTYSHNMDRRDSNNIYSSTGAFINDLVRGEKAIKSVVSDFSSKLIRFPGGSYHREEFKKAVVDYGYHYVDWTLDSLDTKQVIVPADRIVNVVIEGCAGKKQVVILMHDAPVKTTTADALPRIIEYLKEQGYAFKTLE